MREQREPFFVWREGKPECEGKVRIEIIYLKAGMLSRKLLGMLDCDAAKLRTNIMPITNNRQYRARFQRTGQIGGKWHPSEGTGKWGHHEKGDNKIKRDPEGE